MQPNVGRTTTHFDSHVCHIHQNFEDILKDIDKDIFENPGVK